MKLLVTPFQPEPHGRRPERPLFAVGDIHGYLDAFDGLLGHLRNVIEQERPSEPADIVYLGDFIDRGPNPKGVLERAALGLELPYVQERALMGNHDRFLLDAAYLRGRELSLTDWAVWLRNGGAETLAALGDLGFRDATPEALRAALGEPVCAFLRGLKPHWRTGDIFCAHAGVDPDIPLDAQTEQALIWIREPFLSAARDGPAWRLGVTVTHGHTIGAHGVFANRIGVDTGGYQTGVFSAVEISDKGVRFHHLIRE